MMWWDHQGWGTGHWIAMTVMMLVFWGGLIALVVWLIRSMRNDRPAPPRARTADDMLAERFAKGEIEEDEFLRRRELLHSAPPHS
jgi:putative membrane protein